MIKKFYQQQRKESLILRALQNIFLLKIQKSNYDLKDIAISVTRIEMPKTGSFVKVFINIFPEEYQQRFVDDMNKNKNVIRGFMGDALRDKLRAIPDVKFFVDDAVVRMRRIEALLNEIPK